MYDDTLAAGERVATCHAVHLAETTFDAAVNHGMHFGAWFDMLQVGLWVFVEDDAWVHNIVWVEELFHFAHELVGIVAPFAAHEWRHVASRTVLGFE